MRCKYCNSLLEFETNYGYLASHQSGEKLGEIYHCKNSEGFTDEIEFIEYLKETGKTFESFGVQYWYEVQCKSAEHHVSGSFYTDKNGNLHDGYPC